MPLQHKEAVSKGSQAQCLACSPCDWHPTCPRQLQTHCLCPPTKASCKLTRPEYTKHSWYCIFFQLSKEIKWSIDRKVPRPSAWPVHPVTDTQPAPDSFRHTACAFQLKQAATQQGQSTPNNLDTVSYFNWAKRSNDRLIERFPGPVLGQFTVWLTPNLPETASDTLAVPFN